MHIIDGRKIASRMEEEISRKVEGKEIKIVTLIAEGSEESILFAQLKDKACRRVGIEHEIRRFDYISQAEMEREIEELNNDESITGINIQLPLPLHLDYNKLIKKIDERKDVEGLHPYNIGNMLLGNEELIPCTPKAILKILESEKIKLQGKDVVVVNHSNIVGKPLAILLLNRNVTVTVCHIYTKDLKQHTQKADIIITATGVKGLIKEEHVSNESIIIDAGIKKENGKIYGDVDESAAVKAKAVTPVPGGVGPVTIACMLENALISYEKIHKG